MSKSEQVSELLKNYLAELISSDLEAPNFLVTISDLSCSSDMSLAKVYVSVLPENFSGTALKALRSKSSYFAKSLKARTNLNRIPKLRWLIDEGVLASERINKVFEEIERENDN